MVGKSSHKQHSVSLHNWLEWYSQKEEEEDKEQDLKGVEVKTLGDTN